MSYYTIGDWHDYDIDRERDEEPDDGPDGTPCSECGTEIDLASDKCIMCIGRESDMAKGYGDDLVQQTEFGQDKEGQIPLSYKPSEPEAELRDKFPYGHSEFLPITLRELQLHSEKSHDYSSGGHVFGNFQRVAAILALYPELDLADPKVIALTYAMKQLDCVLWGLNSRIEHKVEGLGERLADISVYAKIIMCMLMDDKNGQ